MRLWIDIGNTRLKWQLDNQGSLNSGAFVHHGDWDDSVRAVYQSIQALCEPGELSFIGVAAVTTEESRAAFRNALARYFTVPVAFATVEKTLGGFTCAYEDVSRLGVDRWLSLFAAYSKHQRAVLVISLGSAITIDACDTNGQHLGGFILPGLRMAQAALLSKTDSVRFEPRQAQLDSLEFGRDTASAVSNGLLFEAVAVVQEAWRFFRAQNPGSEPLLVMSGGDASLLSRFIDLPCLYEERLVIEGLKLVFSQGN